MKLIRALRRLRIPLSFGLSVAFIVTAKPTSTSILIGSMISLLGMVLRAWASGCIRKDNELTIIGPYRYTRHPLYLGSLTIGVGFCVACRSVWALLFFLVFFVLVYFPTMIAEAEHLRRLFGEAYERYEQAVPLFFPKLASRGPVPLLAAAVSPSRIDHRQDGEAQPTIEKGQRMGFDFSLYMRNREYQVPIGFTIVLAILLALAYRWP